MRIKSLDDLMQAAAERKSVVTPTAWGRLPAAVVINMQASMVHRHITNGMFIYKPAKKRKARKPHYTEAEWMQIWAREAGPIVCSCGHEPVRMRSDWSNHYLICMNPECARQPRACGSGDDLYGGIHFYRASWKFQQRATRKLLTFPPRHSGLVRTGLSAGKL